MSRRSSQAEANYVPDSSSYARPLIVREMRGQNRPVIFHDGVRHRHRSEKLPARSDARHSREKNISSIHSAFRHQTSSPGFMSEAGRFSGLSASEEEKMRRDRARVRKGNVLEDRRRRRSDAEFERWTKNERAHREEEARWNEKRRRQANCNDDANQASSRSKNQSGVAGYNIISRQYDHGSEAGRKLKNEERERFHRAKLRADRMQKLQGGQLDIQTLKPMRDHPKTGKGRPDRGVCLTQSRLW
jgi:hypothetical protein